MDDGVYVGLDLGTSSLKAVAVDAAGAAVGTATAAYPTYRPEPGAAEQEPQDWFDAIRAAVAALAAQAPARRWRGIGLSGMIPTLVLADVAGAPIGRAITWQDGRAEAYGEALRDAVGADRLYELTGQWVDGRYLLPMAWRLAAEAGTARDAFRARWLLGAKDLIFGWLTGTPATDPSTATGYGCYDLALGDWAQQFRTSLRPDGLPANSEPVILPALPQLPKVLPSTTDRPLLADRAAELGLPSGLPVVLGAADSVLGAYGLGVREPGEVAYLAGTSTVILGISPELVRDHRHRYLVTPLAVGPGWGLEMDLLSTGSAISWLASITAGASTSAGGGPAGGGEAAAALLAAADSLAADARGLPTFLPYLAPGEQGALWDATLAGTVVGLELRHGPAELARALVNGILVESRRCLSVLETASGGASAVRLAGRTTGGAFGADLADATGRPVSRAAGVVADSASAFGAALLARLAVSYAAPTPAHEAPDGDADRGTWSPRAAAAAGWARTADRHDAVRRALAVPAGSA
jgi:xylulokinase